MIRAPLTRAGIVAAFAALAACSGVLAEEDVFSVSGTIAYRERIALPPDSTVRVILADIAKADARAVEVGEYAIKTGNQQVPVAFRITVDRDEFDARGRYAIAAEIRDPAGRLAWRTDTAHGVDTGPASVDVGMLPLVRVAQPAAKVDGLQSGEWVVEDIAGRGIIDNSRVTMTFATDGRVSGMAGCNVYNGGYETSTGPDGPTLQVGLLAVTQRACVPALGNQEAAFLKLLQEAAGYRIDDTGALIVTAQDGATLKARR